MNKHTSHLGRLFDEAAAHYNPQPDVARLERMLAGLGQPSHSRRAGFVVWSAAACFALIGGTAFAFNSQTDDDHRLAPAHSQVDGDEESDSTAVKTTEYHPDKTVPDGGYDPIDKTTLPKPTDPPTTEKKKEQPKTTEPKNTEPPNTEPKDTEPPKPDDGGETWSVYQLYGSSDADPPTEVFWGTANIGDKVKIESEYGWVKVFANDVGAWEAHITFEGAPIGVPFQVWVYGPYHEAVFTFTYLG